MKLAPLQDQYIKEAHKGIQSIIEKLKYTRDKEDVNEFEYMIYELSNLIYDSESVYLRNYYLVQRERDKLFIATRKEHNSDLKTTKVINSKMREDITTLELQKEFIDLCKEQLRSIKRLADHVNNMRIADMADAKRSQI